METDCIWNRLIAYFEIFEVFLSIKLKIPNLHICKKMKQSEILNSILNSIYQSFTNVYIESLKHFYVYDTKDSKNGVNSINFKLGKFYDIICWFYHIVNYQGGDSNLDRCCHTHAFSPLSRRDWLQEWSVTRRPGFGWHSTSHCSESAYCGTQDLSVVISV